MCVKIVVNKNPSARCVGSVPVLDKQIMVTLGVHCTYII